MLLDPHNVADRTRIRFVVRVVFLGPAHRLLQDRMREPAFDPHHDGLRLLVAHHFALQYAFRHLSAPQTPDIHLAAAARLPCAAVLMRAISRRTSRTRAVLASCPVAFWKRRLNCSFLSLISSSSSWSGDIALRSSVLSIGSVLFGNALDEARLDRQLGRGQRQRLLCDRGGHTVDLEQDAARLDADHPVFRSALAGTHADFERLLRHRHIRKDADPHPAGALHVARHRAPRGFDLARRHPVRLHRLETELAEAQRRAAGGDALDPPLVLLAELGATGLQHGSNASLELYDLAPGLE